MLASAAYSSINSPEQCVILHFLSVRLPDLKRTDDYYFSRRVSSCGAELIANPLMMSSVGFCSNDHNTEVIRNCVENKTMLRAARYVTHFCML